MNINESIQQLSTGAWTLIVYFSMALITFIISVVITKKVCHQKGGSLNPTERLILVLQCYLAASVWPIAIMVAIASYYLKPKGTNDRNSKNPQS